MIIKYIHIQYNQTYKEFQISGWLHSKFSICLLLFYPFHIAKLDLNLVGGKNIVIFIRMLKYFRSLRMLIVHII